MLNPAPEQVPVPAKKKRPILLIMLVAVLGVLALCVGGTVIIGLATDNAEKAAGTPAVTTTAGAQPAVVATTPAAPAPTTKPAPPPPPAPPSVEDGVWTVGTDMPAGRYRTTANVQSGCYWAITKTGTNGQDIIANGLPSGGRPSVTLKVGQDFETQDCGKWSKIG